jgi:2-dehydropantoate 2-reductase
MRVLVVGAGALGGYFGGRLVEAGRDVTFLVRPGRAEQIAQHGLRIDSPHGNAHLQPRTVLSGGLDRQYDLILLAVKAYSLAAVMDDFAPAVGPETAILSVLNDMRHLDALSSRFGQQCVLGGVAQIPATLGPEGQVRHLAEVHDLAFGELHGGTSERVRAFAALCDGTTFSARVSEAVVQEMWEKWAFLATLAGMTCLMRAAIGDILASPGGRAAILSLLAECRAVAAAAGHEPRPAFADLVTGVLTKEGSTLTASMQRDIECGAATEGEHVLGDMVERAERLGVPTARPAARALPRRRLRGPKQAGTRRDLAKPAKQRMTCIGRSG